MIATFNGEINNTRHAMPNEGNCGPRCVDDFSNDVNPSLKGSSTDSSNSRHAGVLVGKGNLGFAKLSTDRNVPARRQPKGTNEEPGHAKLCKNNDTSR